MFDANGIASFTPEEIGEIYEKGLADEATVYAFMRELLAAHRSAALVAPGDVKTVALHTVVKGWKSGHWHAVKDMAHELQELGYKVVIFHTLLPEHGEFPQGVQFVMLPSSGDTAQTCEAAAWAIEQACLEYEVDAVILNYYAPWTKYIDLLSFKRVRSARNGQPLQCLLMFHSSFINRQMLDLGSTWLPDNAQCISLFDAVLVESEVDRHFWELYNPNAFFRPLPTGYDPNGFTPSTTQSHDILCLARLSDTKNQLELIQAMRLVAREVPDARLILAGNGILGYDVECRELVSELALEESVVFTGYVEGEQKTQLLQHAGLAVGASRFEGYGIAMAEMKSFGLPLVMYDIPNVVVEDGGEANGTVVVRAHDIEGLAAQVVRLLKDDALRAELGARARRHMQSLYSFDKASFWKTVFSERRPFINSEDAVMQRRVYEMVLQSYETDKERLELERAQHDELVAKLEKDALPSWVEHLEELTQQNAELLERLEANLDRAPHIQRGVVQVEAPAKGYMDAYVTFEEPFKGKPTVVCSIYSRSTSPDIGSISCTAINVKPEGFTARVFNNAESSRRPAVVYVAVGK